MKEKTTDELFAGFANTRNISAYIKDNVKELTKPSLSEYIKKLLNKKNMKAAQAAAKCGLDSSYIHDIVSGRRFNPKRDILIALAFGMGLNCEETSALLKNSGNRELYAKDLRDGIIIHCLANSISIVDCDILLTDNGLRELVKIKKSKKE